MTINNKQAFFEHRDKAGRPMAQKAWTAIASQMFSQIHTEEEHVVSDPTVINQAFETYYTKLYTSECAISIIFNPIYDMHFSMADGDIQNKNCIIYSFRNSSFIARNVI